MNICSKTTKSSLVGERALEIENTLVFSSLYKNDFGKSIAVATSEERLV